MKKVDVGSVGTFSPVIGEGEGPASFLRDRPLGCVMPGVDVDRLMDSEKE